MFQKVKKQGKALLERISTKINKLQTKVKGKAKKEGKAKTKAKIKAKIKEIVQNILFFIKGADLQEDAERVIRVASIVGVSVLVLVLMGRTIYYVTTENKITEKSEKVSLQTEQTENTQVVKTHTDQSLLEQKYSQVVEKVEELMKTNEDLRDAEHTVTDGVDGANGANGENGINGKDGQNGSKGADGQDGLNGQDGQDGANGRDGVDGINGQNGSNGKSVYELALESGYSGSEEELGNTLSNVGLKIAAVETEMITVKQELEETKKSVADGKALIASAENEKGIETAVDSSFQILADHVTLVYEEGMKQGEKNAAGKLASPLNGFYGEMNAQFGLTLPVDYSGETAIDVMAADLETAKGLIRERLQQMLQEKYDQGIADGKREMFTKADVDAAYNKGYSAGSVAPKSKVITVSTQGDGHMGAMIYHNVYVDGQMIISHNDARYHAEGTYTVTIN